MVNVHTMSILYGEIFLESQNNRFVGYDIFIHV